MSDVPTELLSGASIPKLIRYALADWAAIAAIWLVMPQLPAWLYPLWVVLLAGRFHALGVILHDAVHMPLRTKTASVRLLETLAGYPIGSTLDAMRYHHLRHHRDNGLATDPYFKAWIGTSRVRFWLASLRYVWLVPFWIARGAYGSVAAYVPALRTTYARVFLQDQSGADLTRATELIECAREDRWQLLFHVALAGLFAAQPMWVLESLLAPLTLAGYLAGYRVLVEHSLEANHDRGMLTTIRSTRDHHLGILGALLLAPHNVGCHIVHHLHPQAGLENLPQLRTWYRAKYPEIYPA